MPRFRAIIFDLLTALLDSWTLWGGVAGDAELGARRRRKSLEIIYATGPYRPYEEIVAEAAGERAARELLSRWTSSSRGPRRRPSCAASRATTAPPGAVPRGHEGRHNRVGTPSAGREPLAVIATLDPLPDLVR